MDSKQVQPILKIHGVDVCYGSFQALWDVSLEVYPGEIVALIGANASGKSTLLDTISGLLRPTKGSIEFEGKVISGLEPYKVVDMGIAQVPEGRRVFPEMTVYENLIVGSYTGRARGRREANLKNVYEHFPRLRERASQMARTLSGGEQQMLAIGRALMADPKLLLLDEMSLGLAHIVINELYKALEEIRQKGITILFVEQNVKRSLEEADRAYIMQTGKVVLGGRASELREAQEVQEAYFGV